MIVQYYKPNSSNKGCAFSFDIGANNKNQEPCVYIRAVKQYSWNDKTRTGSFCKFYLQELYIHRLTKNNNLRDK